MTAEPRKSAQKGQRPRKRTKPEPQFALMCEGVVDSYHASNREALAAACRKYLETQFSILRVRGARKTKPVAI
jgi:hypothetical protein